MGTKSHITSAASGPPIAGSTDGRAADDRRGIGTGDVQMGALLGVLAVLIALACAAHIDPRVYDSFNIYFQADPPRVLSNMIERTSKWQNATVAHPIFPILSFSLVEILNWFGVPKLVAAQSLVTAAGAVTTVLLFLAIRGLGLSRGAAAGYVALFLTSATFMHWYAFIETFPFAGMSVAGMLCVLTRADTRSRLPWVLGSALTLGITLTNWSLALIAGAVRLAWRDFARTIGGGFLLVLALAVLQRKFFHGAFIFLFHPEGLARSARYNAVTMQGLGMPWDPWKSAQTALTAVGIAPEPYVETAQTDFGPWTIVNNQQAALMDMTALGLVAVCAWLFLLGLGCWGVFRAGPRRTMGLAVLAFCLTQIIFHSFYGEVTFLYAANYCPAMIALMAFGWFTPLRKMSVVAMATFVLCGGINNYRQFETAAALSQQVAIDRANGKALGAF